MHCKDLPSSSQDKPALKLDGNLLFVLVKKSRTVWVPKCGVSSIVVCKILC